MKLSAVKVDQIKPTDRRQEIPDSLCTGLYFVVQRSGKKGWQVRYRHLGVHRRMTLGAYPVLTLALARHRARDALAAAIEGRDPAEEVRAAKAAKPEVDREQFSTVVELFLKRHASRNRRSDDVAAMFRREVLTAWGERKFRDIGKRDVLEVLDRIVDRGSPITANRLRAHLNTLFNWAKGRDIVQINPLDGIKPPAPEKARDRVLTIDEIKLFWQACGVLGQPFGHLLKMLLLTGQRRGEVGGMVECEIRGDVWIIPAARSKNGDEHSLILPKAACAVLAELELIKGKAGYLFTTTGLSPVSGFTRAKARLDKLMAEIASESQQKLVETRPFTLHDLRRTAATGMAGLGFPPHIVEAVLNHRSGTRRGVAGVYNRFDYATEKRDALEAWGQYVVSLVEAKPDDVLELQGLRG